MMQVAASVTAASDHGTRRASAVSTVRGPEFGGSTSLVIGAPGSQVVAVSREPAAYRAGSRFTARW